MKVMNDIAIIKKQIYLLSMDEQIYLYNILLNKAWKKSALISRALNKKNPEEVKYENGYLKIKIETKIKRNYRNHTVIVEVYCAEDSKGKIYPIYGKIYTPAWIIDDKIDGILTILTIPRIEVNNIETLNKIGSLAIDILNILSRKELNELKSELSKNIRLQLSINKK